LARLKAETQQKSAKGKYTEIFLSSKSQKQLTQAFNLIYQGELNAINEQGKIFYNYLIKSIKTGQD
jgi:hypothetical protein